MTRSDLSRIVHQWLLSLGVSIDKKYVNQRLVTHPDFPSALSITSLLDDLGIENNVAQVDQVELSEIKTPFLAFIDNEKFALITQVQQMGPFIVNKRWDGIVVMAEKPESIIEPNELKKIRASTRAGRLKWIAALSALALLTIVSSFNISISNSIFLITALLGLAVCCAIVLQETGVDTALSSKLCNANEEAGCNAVLNSKASNLPVGIKLSDIGVSFFSGITLVLLIGGFSTNDFRATSESFIKVALLISLPLTLVSIYYQWRLIKQWCALCLLVIAILWAASSIAVWQGIDIYLVSASSVLAVLAIFILPGAAWILVRHQLNQYHELKNSNIISQRIYRSPELLEGHLLRQNRIEITPWPYDFQIGNAEAACQLTVVGSHFCGPCSETYEVLQTLIKKHKNNIGITIRILVNRNERAEGKEQVQQHMLQFALSTENFFNQPEKVEQMLEDWYRLKDIKKFKTLYPVNQKIDVEDIIRKQNEWFRSASITYTPTVFVNGYKLEAPYSPNDLLELSSALIEFADAVLEENTY